MDIVKCVYAINPQINFYLYRIIVGINFAYADGNKFKKI